MLSFLEKSKKSDILHKYYSLVAPLIPSMKHYLRIQNSHKGVQNHLTAFEKGLQYENSKDRH